MKNILLIGGAGFIGSNLIKKFQQDGGQIHVCEPEGVYTQRLNGLSVNLHRCSLNDIICVGEIIKNCRIDVVVHLVSTLIPEVLIRNTKKNIRE